MAKLLADIVATDSEILSGLKSTDSAIGTGHGLFSSPSKRTVDQEHLEQSDDKRIRTQDSDPKPDEDPDENKHSYPPNNPT